MIRVLQVVPSLEYAGPTGQMALLVGRLPAEGFDVRVFSLHGSGPLAARLTERGVRVIELPPRRRPVDPQLRLVAPSDPRILAPPDPQLVPRRDRQCDP